MTTLPSSSLFVRKWIIKFQNLIVTLIVVMSLGMIAAPLASAQNSTIYFLTLDGKLYNADVVHPATTSTVLIRSVILPISYTGPFAYFQGLVRKDGYFYTTYGDPSILLRFGFTPGDEVIVGTLPSHSPQLALKSDGSVWVTAHDSTGRNTSIRSLDMQTFTYGPAVIPSPQFFYNISNQGLWEPYGLTFDLQDRLVVNPSAGANTDGNYARFDNPIAATWQWNCGSTTSGLPCWYGGAPLTALATHPITGIIYGIERGNDNDIYLISISPTLYRVTNRTRIDTGLGTLVQNASDNRVMGATFGPYHDTAASCDYYRIGRLIVCL